ncbi:MAG: 3-hydroxybutyryl-CoA dehydrogenase [Deltaproteobacteria bacterium]|nr:3-hydroxybutyryl-CoA dehydrogenase [Deltaproteobacteria bacterium]MCZ6549516.1 3-hydroxyacyl-CoA dehydrogenase family protein [Deltaproteobacteria bacterium]
MGQSSIAIIGRSRLAEELHRLSRDKGFDAALYPDAEKVAASSSIAVETLAGSKDRKRKIIEKLDTVLAPSSVLLTSCLGLSTTHVASWVSRPERVVGFATFYPLEGKRVIELAGGLKTQEGSLKEAEGFFRALGKETVRTKDTPGLIFPRILSLIINEAVRSLDEGVAEAEEIDTGLRLGTNYPLGPLRWADQIGLNEVLAVLEGLQRETGDDRYRPSPLLKRMVLAGQLGESTGQAFYQYSK